MANFEEFGQVISSSINPQFWNSTSKEKYLFEIEINSRSRLTYTDSSNSISGVAVSNNHLKITDTYKMKKSCLRNLVHSCNICKNVTTKYYSYCISLEFQIIFLKLIFSSLFPLLHHFRFIMTNDIYFYTFRIIMIPKGFNVPFVKLNLNKLQVY